MTAQDSDVGGTASERDTENASEDRKALSYEGSRVPLFVILIWVVFFVWGLVYLLRWIPESWREWFSR